MPPRIVLATDTFGTEPQNGVARFTCGVHAYSRAHELPLHVFSSGDHLRHYEGVHNVHGLSWGADDIGETELYYPLEGRRREMRRKVKEIDPDVVHISTPGAIGLTALAIAERQDRLIAGVYHTDFPAFARKMVHDALEGLLEGGGWERVQSLASPLWEHAHKYLERWERRLLGWLVRRVLRRNRAAFREVLHRGVAWISEAAAGVVREFLRELHGRFGLTIARSETYRRILTDDLGLPPERVAVLRCGVDTSLFSPEKTDADAGLRERLGVPGDACVALYVGRVTDEKGMGYLAEVWQAYQARPRSGGRKTVLVLAGGGKLDEFKRRAGGRDVYLLGPRSGKELSAIYRLADVFWTPSATESLGQVVLEAQASGVPAIVSDQGAARENVKDGETGLVLPLADPRHWAGTLSRLLADPGRRARMGQAAREATKDKTIAVSYRHFWQLHQEFFEREQAREKLGVFAGLPMCNHVPPPADGWFRRRIFLSDYHPGLGQKTAAKEGALQVIRRRADEHDASIYLLGDFADTRAEPDEMREELLLLRRTIGPRVRAMLEGNHDWEFARAGVLAEYLGCGVEASLVKVLPGGIVATHGHVGELPELERILRSGLPSDEIVAALTIDRLRPQLKWAACEYDCIGVVEQWLEDAGLEGLDDMWRNIEPVRHRVAELLAKALRIPGLEWKSDVVETAIRRIGAWSREKMLLALCEALGGGILIYGHTHEPSVRTASVLDPVSKLPREVVVANTGSFRRKRLPPTWVEVQGRTVCLYGYDQRTNAAVLINVAAPHHESAGAGRRPGAGRAEAGGKGGRWVQGLSSNRSHQLK